MAKPISSVNPLALGALPDQCKSMASNDKSREDRLAQALRENLRRRKAQARELKPEDKPRRD